MKLGTILTSGLSWLIAACRILREWLFFGMFYLALIYALEPKLCSKETTCMAGSLRKNRNRTDTTKRQKIGSRFDGVVQDSCGHLEYAAMEASSSFISETGTKWLLDYRKVAKALHDMLFRLQSLVDHDSALLEKLQVAGLVSAGKSYFYHTHIGHFEIFHAVRIKFSFKIREGFLKLGTLSEQQLLSC